MTTLALEVETPAILDLSICVRGDRPPMHRLAIAFDRPEDLIEHLLNVIRACRRARVDPWPIFTSAIRETHEGRQAVLDILNNLSFSTVAE